MLARTPTIASLLAAVSLAATPAAAAELPTVSDAGARVETGAPISANNHRYGYRRYRNRVGAGEVIAGVAILGTIAAIASASRQDRYRDRYDPRYRDRDYRIDRGARYERGERYDSRGIDRAVDMCVDAVERDRDNVNAVDNAARAADGWRVSGTLENGGGWSCWIDNSGRIRDIDMNAGRGGDYSAGYGTGYDDDPYSDDRYGAVDPEPAGDQWSEQAYARARATTRTPADGGYTYRDRGDGAYAGSDYGDEGGDYMAGTGAQPAYPGGPLPGEEGYGDAADTSGDGGWEGDGRYDTAQSPDFDT